MAKFSEQSDSLKDGALAEIDIQRLLQTGLMATVLEDDPMNIITNCIAEVRVVENSDLEDDSKVTVAKNDLVFHSSNKWKH